MEEIRRVLGKRIRDARKERDITQKELGELLKYSPMAISHFENGIRELKLSDVQKLADFFGKPLAYFFPADQAPAISLYRAQPSDDPEVLKSLERFEKYLNTIDERTPPTP